jgi:hypothetical protein
MNMAHHVRVLPVAAHAADHPAAGRVLDDPGEPVADLLELHPLRDHPEAAPAVDQCPLSTHEKPPRRTQTIKSSSK